MQRERPRRKCGENARGHGEVRAIGACQEQWNWALALSRRRTRNCCGWRTPASSRTIIFFGAGALVLEGGAGVLVRMTFERNIADSSAIVVHDANLVVRDSSFVENRGGAGGGPLVASGSTVDIFNTTFVGNTVSPTFPGFLG